jgi:hypothetical protein
MKKIVASVGLFAVGASGVQAASPAALTADATKPWSVSATLRGFYDDNVGTAPKGNPTTESFGFEVRPGFNLNWGMEQTTISLGYLYSFRYYDHRPPGNSEKYDQSHIFNALVNHAFSERYVLNVTDSFVIGQEPDLLRATETFNSYQRIPGNNIRNYGTIKFSAQHTPVFGSEIGYDNSFFNYADENPHFDDSGTVFLFPSNAGLLDRIEHYLHIDARWTILPNTVGVLGYRYSEVDYTANELIGEDIVNGAAYKSDSRNARAHYGYLGVDHVFRPDLSATVRAGARYNDYYNEPDNRTDVSPSVQASLTYVYAPESSLSLGLTHDMNATDLFSAQGGNLTTDAETTTVYGTLTHRILPHLYGSLTGQFQNSTLNGGTFNNENELYYLVGLNLEYRFNLHLSTHIGYNYDKLDSDVGRSFDRNRVYVGVTATY